MSYSLIKYNRYIFLFLNYFNSILVEIIIFLSNQREYPTIYNKDFSSTTIRITS